MWDSKSLEIVSEHDVPPALKALDGDCGTHHRAVGLCPFVHARAYRQPAASVYRSCSPNTIVGRGDKKQLVVNKAIRTIWLNNKKHPCLAKVDKQVHKLLKRKPEKTGLTAL